MFTKCPECSISFRVTAKVLQQAKGNVRCGGCEHVFSALEYLSEEMPEAGDEATAGASSDKLAETSRRLLKTLDDLAGPDEVRIEDTGIEWRVLDKDDESEASAEINTTEEMRYDDSTLLPDDFGQERDESYTPPAPGRRATDQADSESEDFDALQQDLALSEPDDWTDLLDEVRDPESESESLEVEEELAAIHNQLSVRDESTARTAEPADLDSQFDTQAEAMGLDLRAAGEEALTDEVPLLDEEDIDSHVEPDEDDADEIMEETADDSDQISIVEDEAADMSADSAIEDTQESDDEETDDEGVTDDSESEVEALDDAEDEFDDEKLVGERKSTGEFEAQIDVAARSLSGDDEDDQAAENETSPDVDEPDDDDVALELENDSSEDVDSAEIEHIVPPPTEEEMTVNMEIDQEMMALATKDDEFSATLVGMKNPEELFSENAEDVETIIMEGEFVRGAIELEKLADENAAKGQLDEPGNLADTYALSRDKIRGGRRRYDPSGYSVTAAIIVLVLALAGQFIHSSRESLATIGLFNQTVAPVYRMLGSPVTPAWDIKGWQFEVTNGSVDESEMALTIVSRIVNRAEQPLPYPLVHVSLTDRWEDIMGSRILEPGEYLAGDLDPSSPVLPGENFTAVITIENPSAEATGFKLNVCYRVSSGTVRCAIEDFKN